MLNNNFLYSRASPVWMVDSRALERVGLRRNEARIYRALLKLGSAKAGRIAKEAGVERTSTYNALQALLTKGLASYVTIGKIRWYQPAPPERLVAYYEARRERAEQLLPELSQLYEQTALPQNVRLFKGVRGVKSVLNDILHERMPNLIFGSEGQLEQRIPHFAERFTRELRERGITVRSLVREDRAGAGVHADVRLVPRSVESPVVTNIYANKIALIIWTEPPEAVLIENAAAAAAYRSYFELLWAGARKA